jgi:hypothetical protein
LAGKVEKSTFLPGHPNALIQSSKISLLESQASGGVLCFHQDSPRHR